MLNTCCRFVNSLTWWYILKTSWRYFSKMSWRRLQNVLKMSWARFCKTSWRHMAKTNIMVLTKTSWRCMAKVNMFVLIKTSWRRKTSSSRRMFGGSSKSDSKSLRGIPISSRLLNFGMFACSTTLITFKNVRIWSYSGPHFSVSGLNEIPFHEVNITNFPLHI